MMIKLYEKNGRLAENTTKVTCFLEVNSEYYIGLEESIFFPEEGGQNADTGEISWENNIINVLDGKLYKGLDKAAQEALEDRDDIEVSKELILYKVSGPISEGQEVHCILDYGNRYDRMQNHSGEHILTGVIHREYGFDNVGFHLSDEGPVTLDINGKLTYEQVMDMEKEANRVIYANMPIVDSYPAKEELAGIDYRSKIEIDGQVRLITIGDENETVDVCACCAPHVKRTGEVGIIKIVSVVNWKGGIRISMLAGRRALEYINSEHEIIKSLTGLLTTSPDNLLNITKSHIEELGELKGKLAVSLETGIISRIDNAVTDVINNGATCSDGLVCGNHVEFVESDFPAASMKNIYNHMLSKYNGYVAIIAGDDETGYRYFGGSISNDSRELAAILREKFNAKGGGKPDMVQGQIEATASAITEVIMGL